MKIYSAWGKEGEPNTLVAGDARPCRGDDSPIPDIEGHYGGS
jgi:hypothetical protein